MDWAGISLLYIVKSIGKCRKDECIYIWGFSLRSTKREPGNTGNRSSLSRPHKRLGDKMDYNRVIEIALGILIALAIGWVFLKYGLGFLYVVVIVMGFIYIVFLILRILRG